MSDELDQRIEQIEEATPEDLAAWYVAQEALRKAKDTELALRLKIFKDKFRAPVEGINKYDLPDGYVLKGTHVINRKVDEPALITLRPIFQEKGLKVDELVQFKPELRTGEYRKLTEEQRMMFDQVLIIKPGTPSLEIVLPKRK